MERRDTKLESGIILARPQSIARHADAPTVASSDSDAAAGKNQVEHYRFPAQARVMIQTWFPYAVAAAILYGLHQIFTKLAADRISDGLGSLVVEGTAAFSIVLYLGALFAAGRWNQAASAQGVWYSAITGICVGAGTIVFFLLFQKGGPLSAVPVILACGAALMAIAGILFFKEPASWPRLLGIALAILGLLLLRAP